MTLSVVLFPLGCPLGQADNLHRHDPVWHGPDPTPPRARLGFGYYVLRLG